MQDRESRYVRRMRDKESRSTQGRFHQKEPADGSCEYGSSGIPDSQVSEPADNISCESGGAAHEETGTGTAETVPVRIAGCVRHSAVDGPGVRYVLFLQGCPHHCPGCQNPDTHDPGKGVLMTAEEAAARILRERYLDGVTLSGGDPLMQPEAVLEIGRRVHKAGLPVWCYTGWTWEEILDGKAGKKAEQALEEIDVLVDGRYADADNTERSPGGRAAYPYRGSTNQRLIDVKRSLAAGICLAWTDE